MANENLYPPVHFPTRGRPLKYTPKRLQEKFVEYVEWCKDNPIVIGTEIKNTSVEGIKYGATTEERKPRLVSIGGFLVYIGATRRWWGELDDAQEDFSVVKDLIREFCEAYQKEMASAGIFNSNIISRLLGLVDKQQQESRIENRIVVENQDQAEKIKSIGDIG